MNSALARLEGVSPSHATGWRGVLADYFDLTKPRIITLLLVTTLAAMIMAARGLPPVGLTLLTLLAGSFAAGRVEPAHALLFASVLGGTSFAIFYLLVNPLAAWLSLSGNLFYVVVYTLWLKRRTTLNIVIGGAAGAVPPLVGWAAVTHTIGAPALALFALVFLWTPPHFWALALMTETDYERAKVPMLPNVRGVPRTKLEIAVYAVLMVAMSLALVPLHVMSVWYFVPAALLGAIFLIDALRLFGGATKTHARALFKFSILYLALMCLVMVFDRVVA